MVSLEQWRAAIGCFNSNGIVKRANMTMYDEKNCSLFNNVLTCVITLLVYANICLMLLVVM